MLLAGLVATAVAQRVDDFKVGDWAQIWGGGDYWSTVTVATPLNAGSYYVNKGGSTLPPDPRYLRHYQPTAEELRVANETAAAKNRQPKGDTLGAKFGTREPPLRARIARVRPMRPRPNNTSTAIMRVSSLRLYLSGESDVVIQIGSARASITIAIPWQPVSTPRRRSTTFAAATLRTNAGCKPPC